jgi:type I restriction enzyme M protein
LFESKGRAGYSQARVDGQRVKATILNHAEYAVYSKRVATVFQAWWDVHQAKLTALKEGVKPKAVIAALSEDILERFAALPLLNKYDVYQRLMDYWVETMQDDVFSTMKTSLEKARRWSIGFRN